MNNEKIETKNCCVCGNKLTILCSKESEIIDAYCSKHDFFEVIKTKVKPQVSEFLLSLPSASHQET